MIKEFHIESDVLFIIPPFVTIEIQSLAVHNLQACLKAKSISSNILYLNMHFYTKIKEHYNSFSNMNYFLLGERVFSKAAWGDEVKEQFTNEIYDYNSIYGMGDNPIIFYPANKDIDLKDLKKIEKSAINWLTELEHNIKDLKYKYIGLTCSFEQVNATFAILKLIKKHNPDIVTFMGGFNCEKELSEGISSLDPQGKYVDFIFSGEGEISLTESISSLEKNKKPKSRIIHSKPIKNLDMIPEVDYSEYFEQLSRWAPDLFNNKKLLNIAFESSRGCWWGELHQCKFCGTPDRVKFREKSLDKIKKELKSFEKWNINKIHCADLIMPKSHYKEVIPYLVESNKNLTFFYEQKVPISREEMRELKACGIIDLQPGLETLSTTILKKMNKGTTLLQNIAFLRDALSIGVNAYWNIVWGVPGETNKEYKDINNIIDIISHLTPPVATFHMNLVKFSPYFNEPEKYGITDISPLPSYNHVYPGRAKIENIALVYRCNYNAETHDDPREILRMMDSVELWNKKWESNITKPRLFIYKQNDKLLLVDTRGINNNSSIQEVSYDQLKVLLDKEIFNNSKEQLWAIENKLAILENNILLSIVIIDDEIRKEYENRS